MIIYKNATHVVKRIIRDGWALYGVYQTAGGLICAFREELEAIEKAIELNRKEETK